MGEARVSRSSRPLGNETGLAQASQSAAGIWLTDDTASRVISDDAIEKSGPATRYDQPSHHGDRRKDRALHQRLQGLGPRIRFPAETLQRSSDRYSARRV